MKYYRDYENLEIPQYHMKKKPAKDRRVFLDSNRVSKVTVKPKFMYLRVSYAYSGAIPKKVFFLHSPTYKVPCGMTKKEAVTLLVYFMGEFIHKKIVSNHVQVQEVDTASNYLRRDYLTSQISKDLTSVGFSTATEQEAKEHQENIMQLYIVNTADKKLAKSTYAANFDAWRTSYSQPQEDKRLLSKYMLKSKNEPEDSL